MNFKSSLLHHLIIIKAMIYVLYLKQKYSDQYPNRHRLVVFDQAQYRLVASLFNEHVFVYTYIRYIRKRIFLEQLGGFSLTLS